MAKKQSCFSTNSPAKKTIVASASELPKKEDDILPLPNQKPDKIYRSFLKKLSLQKEHVQYFIHQGWSKELIMRSMVRTIPSSKKNTPADSSREKIAKSLLQEFGSPKGVPGFYENNYGKWTFAGACGILIPLFDHENNLYRLRIRSKQGSVVYTDPFAKKRKYGYFYLKSIPEEIVHIIDLSDFLTDILLIQTLHHIQTKIKLLAVQNIFETFIQIHSKPDQRLKDTWEVNEFISSLIFKTVLPGSLLFHDYSSEESEYFELGLSYDISEKLIQVHFGGLRREVRRACRTNSYTPLCHPPEVLSCLGLSNKIKYFAISLMFIKTYNMRICIGMK